MLVLLLLLYLLSVKLHKETVPDYIYFMVSMLGILTYIPKLLPCAKSVHLEMR